MKNIKDYPITTTFFIHLLGTIAYAAPTVRFDDNDDPAPNDDPTSNDDGANPDNLDHERLWTMIYPLINFAVIAVTAGVSAYLDKEGTFKKQIEVAGKLHYRKASVVIAIAQAFLLTCGAIMYALKTPREGAIEWTGRAELGLIGFTGLGLLVLLANKGCDSCKKSAKKKAQINTAIVAKDGEQTRQLIQQGQRSIEDRLTALEQGQSTLEQGQRSIEDRAEETTALLKEQNKIMGTLSIQAGQMLYAITPGPNGNQTPAIAAPPRRNIYDDDVLSPDNGTNGLGRSL